MDPNYGHQIAALNAPKSTFTDETMDRLAEMIKTADDTVCRLAVVRDRTFGCSPENASGSGGPVPVPNGKADEISQALAGLADRLYRANSLAADLQSRL